MAAERPWSYNQDALECPVYAGPDVRMLAPVLMAVTALLSPMAREAHATTRGRGCHRQCASTFIDTLEQQCASCAPGIIAARKECNQRANGLFDTCKGQCPGFPGRCTITRECVNGCRDQRTGRGGKCAHQFMRRLRRCSGSGQCLAGARKARRQCLRLCRTSATATAPATEAPPAATSSASSGAGGPGCTCQPDCIVGIVGGCYDDCNDRCDGDGDALPICRMLYDLRQLRDGRQLHAHHVDDHRNEGQHDEHHDDQLPPVHGGGFDVRKLWQRHLPPVVRTALHLRVRHRCPDDHRLRDRC